MRDWNRKWPDAFTWTRFCTTFFQTRQIKQQQQQKQQQPPAALQRWDSRQKHWQTLAKTARTCWDSVWHCAMRFFAVKHKLIETYFDDLVSSEFESVADKRQLYPYAYSVSSGVEVCLASSNMCCPIRTNAFHWYRRQAGLKFSDKWNLIMKISWISRWFEALHVQLQFPCMISEMRPFQKYTFVDHGARFLSTYFNTHANKFVVASFHAINGFVTTWRSRYPSETSRIPFTAVPFALSSLIIGRS